MLKELWNRLQRDTLSKSATYKPFVVYENVFSETECKDIIALAAEKKLEVGRVMTTTGDGEQNEVIRKMKSRWIYSTENKKAAALFQKIEDVALKYNKIHYRFDLLPTLDKVLFNAYAPEDYYSWHQDFGPGPFSTRKLSLVVQLSNPDEYEGGELQFFSAHAGSKEKHYTIPKRQGSVVVFPAFEFHRVTPVSKGDRYSLVCLMLGPTFR